MPLNSPLYIILNGASETGKSTLIAKGLMHRFRLLNQSHDKGTFDKNPHDYELLAVQDSFAAPMKHYIATALGTKYADLKKNVMMGVLQGYSPREFLIDLSENYMKRRYGDDIFGRLLVHRILRLDPLPDLVIIDDGGFVVEREVIDHHARVVRITRPGKTFEGDSRMHLPDPHYELANNSTINALEDKLDDLANWIIHQLPENRRPPAV